MSLDTRDFLTPSVPWKTAEQDPIVSSGLEPPEGAAAEPTALTGGAFCSGAAAAAERSRPGSYPSPARCDKGYGSFRREAVVSSQIEGTQATLVDLLTFELEQDAHPPGADVEEICNYLDALAYARGELAEPAGLPLSMRLLNETHRRLMRGVRGSDKQPGERRRTQNWIGGTRPGNAVFVPPPPHLLGDTLSAFETGHVIEPPGVGLLLPVARPAVVVALCSPRAHCARAFTRGGRTTFRKERPPRTSRSRIARAVRRTSDRRARRFAPDR